MESEEDSGGRGEAKVKSLFPRRNAKRNGERVGFVFNRCYKIQEVKVVQKYCPR